MYWGGYSPSLILECLHPLPFLGRDRERGSKRVELGEREIERGRLILWEQTVLGGTPAVLFYGMKSL